MRDRVVQLASDPRPLLHDGLTCCHVALPLRQLRAALPIAHNPADEQHHDERDDGEGHGALERDARGAGESQAERSEQQAHSE